MSWKGFQKGVVRAPQTLRQRMNMGHITKDPVYIDAERRFAAIENATRKLHSESKRYWDAISNMLNHQIEYSKAIEEIYKPISGRVSDPDSVQQEGNPEGIAACQQYRDLVTELQQLLAPELEMIESRILQPADELLTITQSIKKMLTKRDHKQLDLDRHGQALKKLQDRKDRNVKQEEKMFKVENDYEIAMEEYNYYNELLKAELPKLFLLEGEFIKPLFQSFYFMQLNIFYTMFSHMEEMKIPYFNLSGDIVKSFAQKRADVKERTEEIGITHFRVGHAKAKLEATKRKFGKAGANPSASPGSYDSHPPPSYPGYPEEGYSQEYGQSGYHRSDYAESGYAEHEYDGYSREKQEYTPSPTEYGSPAAAAGSPTAKYPAVGSPAVGSPVVAAPAASGSAPAAAPATEWCTALYEFTAEAEGDLGFSAGERIEIVERSGDANGWWTGRLHGKQGIFPGNYVQLD